MLRITDKRFKYTPSHETDLKAKFAKIIREQKRNAEEAKRVVAPLRKAAK